MKSIKLRIVYYSGGACALCPFHVAVRCSDPRPLCKRGERRCANEAEYENRTIPYTYEGEAIWDGRGGGAFLRPQHCVS